MYNKCIELENIFNMQISW